MSLKTRAELVQKHARELSKLISEGRHRPFSFEADIPQEHASISDANFQVARIALIESCRDLLELAIGPRDMYKITIPVSIQFNAALAVVVHFKFAENMPPDSETSITFLELAKKVGLHHERVERVLRCVAAHRIFKEEPLGSVCHTAASKLLLDYEANAWLSHQLEEMLPASASLVESLKMYPGIDSDRETAFSVAFSGDQRLTYWEILEKSPSKVQTFSDGLKFATVNGDHQDSRAVIACYDWKKFGAAKVVDVGGSSGRVSIAIAKHADEEMTFIIQDLPELAPVAKKAIDNAGLSARMRFEPHNFFEPQPVRDARVYVYRQILHDWPDQMAIDILRAAIPALNAGDYIILLEAVFPSADTSALPNPIERLIRATDLLMMSKHNSKERTLSMWKTLVQAADARFMIEEVVAPAGQEAGAVIAIRWTP